MKVAIVESVGDHNAIKIKEAADPVIKADEVLVKNSAVGVNFFDVCFRRGQYKLPNYPAILGFEACGIIEKIGKNVSEFSVGDRVAYATSNKAYAEKTAVHQNHLVVVPKEISDVEAAGSLAKGLTAHMLLFRVYVASRAGKILVHAAAGGVGQFLCQIAKAIGIEVIGTVGSDEKIDIAKLNGCRHVINYTKSNFVEELAQITQGQGVGVVYDGVGKSTLLSSTRCVWPMGMCVSYGESSGNTESFDLNELVANSVYITRPKMFMYKANRAELVMSADQIFEGIKKKSLTPKISTYSFKNISQAHEILESRASTGSLVLTF